MYKAVNDRPHRSRVSTIALVALLALLLLPAFAISRLARTFDPRFIAGYLILISAVTYLFYRHDKNRAATGGWRTPESTLHLAELLGGWPGAFLAQRILRHKISKTSYQVKYSLIVVLHQFVAFDFIQGWPYSRKAFSLLHS
jgi:uncharacterized membrane protein YsdA (DUF1294 family)